ncbi:MAG: Ig-like domain-containing protein [Deltaproteobacteria bacterium]|nr:Ig-like domain-containing protein [Deltaproteobacteria bacterium]
MKKLISLLLSGFALSACQCDAPVVEPTEVLGDGFGNVVPIDASTVLILFSEPINAATVPGSFDVRNFTTVPPRDVDTSAAATGSDEVTITAAQPLVAGTRYTIVVDGVTTASGRALSGTLNFTGEGTATTTTVRVVVADVETARRHEDLALVATVAADGSFSEELVPYAIVDDGAVFSASLTVAVDAARTLDTADDGDVALDRRPYALMLVDGAGRLASALVPFVVPADVAADVVVTILPPLEIIDEPIVDALPAPPVDDNIGDGLRQVRIVVDDRASKELVTPSLKVSFLADGSFDATFPQTLPLTAMTGDDAGYWEVTVGVRVDPARVVDGTTTETFPYFAFLSLGDLQLEALSVSVTAPDETPQTVRLSLGNPDWTPVTFRVDASKAYLNASGSERGVRAGEAVFLTGEWAQAVDALGSNCGDAFSGGEQTCLKMKELDPIPGERGPGVWSRTVWLPPGRPYGWKAVRCDAATGCGPLNRLVASSGRAFATVMKNLATDNVDAFADAACGIVDPINPSTTTAGAQTLDYTGAAVFQGAGTGGEPDPAGTPDGARMFKQEVPDLVVVVANQALKTRVVHIGTWRDVNLGVTPQEILDDNLAVDLGLADYDDGFIGRFPPSRDEP